MRSRRLFIDHNTRIWCVESAVIGLLGVPAYFLGSISKDLVVGSYILLLIAAVSWQATLVLVPHWHCYTTDAIDTASNGTCNGYWGIALTPAGDEGAGDTFLQIWVGVSWFLVVCVGLVQIYFGVQCVRGIDRLFVDDHTAQLKKIGTAAMGRKVTDGEIEGFEHHVGRRPHVNAELVYFIRVWLSPFSYLLDTSCWGARGSTPHSIRRIGLNAAIFVVSCILYFLDSLVGGCPAEDSFEYITKSGNCRIIFGLQIGLISIIAALSLVSCVLMTESESYYRTAIKEDAVVMGDEFIRYLRKHSKTHHQ